jgi:hypothetical protein
METPVARLTEDDQVLRTFLGESLIGAVVDLEAAHAVAELATALGLIDRQEPLADHSGVSRYSSCDIAFNSSSRVGGPFASTGRVSASASLAFHRSETCH